MKRQIKIEKDENFDDNNNHTNDNKIKSYKSLYIKYYTKDF